MDNSLIVSVKSPEMVYFEGEAQAVSSFNDKGPFDVLPMHTNFISLVKNMVIIHQKNNISRQIKIDGGILRVFHNNVHIFLGIDALQK